jgi:hypothetical protein
VTSFRSQYVNVDGDLDALRARLQSFCRQTLRRQVVECIQFTERRPIAVRFRPTDDEQQLYQAVSDFLKREDTISVPQRQRHLVALILHKLLASSSHAIANTLETMKARLEALQHDRDQDDNRMDEMVEAIEEAKSVWLVSGQSSTLACAGSRSHPPEIQALSSRPAPSSAERE